MANKDDKTSTLDLLVEAAQGGDTGAFARIYDRLVTPIYRYVYYRVDPAIAEDLTEEVFLRAWQHLGNYERKKWPFTAWVFKIAHNLVVDHYRRHKGTDELSEQVADDNGSHHPVYKVELKLNRLTLKKSIRRLPDSYQQVIVLKYVNDLDNAEISKITGKSEGAIRLIQFRALAELRSMMEHKRDDF